jgi:hypothetical protein
VSLLNRGTDTVKVFEVRTPDTDTDGNKRTRAAKVGTLVRAVVQPISSSENAAGGFNREPLPAPVDQLPEHPRRSVVDRVEGKRYSMEGEGLDYNGSRRTAHVDYVMVRK